MAPKKDAKRRRGAKQVNGSVDQQAISTPAEVIGPLSHHRQRVSEMFEHEVANVPGIPQEREETHSDVLAFMGDHLQRVITLLAEGTANPDLPRILIERLLRGSPESVETSVL